MKSHMKDTPQFGDGQGPIKFPRILDATGLLVPSFLDCEGRLLPVQARKIPPKPLSLSGYVAFPSMRMLAGFESGLERDSLLLIKDAPARLGLLAQPVTLDRRALGGGKGAYTPDLLVWTVDKYGEPLRVTLVEVKPELDLTKHWRKIKPKLQAARRFARHQGWRFIVVTERHLRNPLPIQATWSRRPSPKYELLPSGIYTLRLFGERWKDDLR